MKTKSSTCLLALTGAAALLAALPGHARAQANLTLSSGLAAPLATTSPINVYFSFTGTAGNSPGTVTGELVFAAAGTGVPATDVYVFSGPAGTLSASQANVDYAPFAYNSGNAFTVSAAGVVTAANLNVNNAANNSYLALNAAGNGNANDLYNYNTGDYTLNQAGFSGITFTPAAPAPEPSTWALLGVGVAGAGVVVLRRRSICA